MKHLCTKQSLSLDKVPIILKEFGNTGGASIPLTLTEAKLTRPSDKALRLMLLGYGVGLSWGSALVDLDSQAILESIELDNSMQESA
jgi:3-oxoacyl-[acyl-carrier-protein] synthase-3